jgi:hypothetical protein
VFLLLAGAVWAAEGYDLSWHAIPGGGGESAAGAYTLDGGVLQPAGAIEGGDYELQSGFWSGASAAAPGPVVALRFSPVNSTVYRCSSPFTVDLDVRDVSNLAGFEITLAFDATSVHVENIVLGSFLTGSGRSFTPLGPSINNGTGRATFGAFSFGSGPAPSGSGPIATITFSVVDSGSSALALPRFQLTDPDAHVIPAGAESGSVTVLPGLSADVDCDCDVDIVDIMLVASRWGSVQGDANYDPRCDRDGDGDIDIVDIMLVASHWGESCGMALGEREGPERAAAELTGREALSRLMLRIEPASSVVQPGDVFTVQVMADEATDVGGFEFTLTFNGEVLSVEETELGPFLGSTGRSAQALGPAIDQAAGSLAFGGFSYGAAPGATGGGMVAHIRLRAVAAGSSTLLLSAGRFTDTRGQAGTAVGAGEGSVVVSSGTEAPAEPMPVLTPQALATVAPMPTREGP